MSRTAAFSSLKYSLQYRSRGWVLVGGLLLCAPLVLPQGMAWGQTAPKPYDHSLDAPLSEAIVAGNADEVTRLLTRGADPNAKTPDDSATSMLALAAATSVDLTQKLFDAGANLETGNSRGNSPLVVAAMTDHADTAKLLLKLGAKLESNLDGGRTALMFAAATGHTEVAQALLEAGANPNALSTDGGTPLIYGSTKTEAGSGNLEIAKLLVGAGADVSVKLANGSDAIALCRANGLNDIADYLDTIRKRDESLLEAASQHDWAAMKTALDQGANPRYETTLYEDEGDTKGRTTTAAMWLRSDAAGYDDALATQIVSHSNLEARDDSGETALYTAVVNRDLPITQLLLKAGANPNVIAPATGQTPLMVAAQYGTLPMVQALIAAGAKKETRTQKGESALSLAGSDDIRQVLR